MSCKSVGKGDTKTFAVKKLKPSMGTELAPGFLGMKSNLSCVVLRPKMMNLKIGKILRAKGTSIVMLLTTSRSV